MPETKEKDIQITNETDLTKLKFRVGMKVLNKKRRPVTLTFQPVAKVRAIEEASKMEENPVVSINAPKKGNPSVSILGALENLGRRSSRYQS